MYICQNEHLHEIALTRMYSWPNGHFSENLFSRINTCQTVDLAKWTFSPKTYFSELTLARLYIWPNGHFPKWIFSRIDSCQNVHLAGIRFTLKLIFQKLHFLENSFSRNYFSFEKYTTFRLFISKQQNKLLVEIKKCCDNS